MPKASIYKCVVIFKDGKRNVCDFIRIIWILQVNIHSVRGREIIYHFDAVRRWAGEPSSSAAKAVNGSRHVLQSGRQRLTRIHRINRLYHVEGCQPTKSPDGFAFDDGFQPVEDRPSDGAPVNKAVYWGRWLQADGRCCIWRRRLISRWPSAGRWCCRKCRLLTNRAGGLSNRGWRRRSRPLKL